MKIIEVKNLVKKYGKFTAVSGISFSVNKGEIFGLLGENGAGKTTTLEIIEGLRKATSGEVKVSGHNMHEEPSAIKEKIGVQLQSSAYYNFLTLTEILNLFASFYSKSANARELLKMVDLDEKANAYVGNLSGGQKQRFSIVASLVNDPEVVFLDEPTTGLDPLARRNLWDLITKIKQSGKTVVLTTHYMEEAERLCDRIAIMDKGKILVEGETHTLIANIEYPYKVEFVAKSITEGHVAELMKYGILDNIAQKEKHFGIRLKNQEEMQKALNLIVQIVPEDLKVTAASLEDLFIELTGKRITE